MEFKFSAKNAGLWGLCLALNIITFLVIHYKIHPAGGIANLHFNVLVGVDAYGRSENLYILPAAALFFSILNYVLYRTLTLRRYFVPALIIFVTLLLQSSMLLASLFLVRIN